MIHMIGAIKRHCTTKRAAVIWPTGTLLEASLAATSNKGAVTQNPSNSTTPVKMRSVDGVSACALVMHPAYDDAHDASIDFEMRSTKRSVAMAAHDRMGGFARQADDSGSIAIKNMAQ